MHIQLPKFLQRIHITSHHIKSHFRVNSFDKMKTLIFQFLYLIVLTEVKATPLKFNGCSFFKNDTGSNVIFYHDKLCNEVTEKSCINEFDMETRSKVDLLKFECKFAPVSILIEEDLLSKYPKLHTVDISSLEAPALNVILNGSEIDGAHRHTSYNVNILKAFNNRLRHIPKSLFVLMPNISEIDFSYNQFQTLTSTCFNGAQQLTKINFSHNHLTSVANGVFVQLEKLRVLDFSANELEALKSHAFLADDNKYAYLCLKLRFVF